MNPTELLYLEDFKLLNNKATVVEIRLEDGRVAVILDQTIFYPQGGGQPFDLGSIKGAKSTFTVTDVRLVDGIVKHFGTFDGSPFQTRETVNCIVDAQRRSLHNRIHSAGHIIDKALVELNITWQPGKSFHFANGPYVEYTGSLVGIDKDKLKADIERICNGWIQQGLDVKSIAMDKSQLTRRCQFVPSYIPEGKPVRVIFFGEFCSPCGEPMWEIFQRLGV